MITIEQLEALAAQAENDNAAEYGRLLRLCRVMVRILAARQPAVFLSRASSITDESGHFDNSYPPKAEHHYEHAVPRMIQVRAYESEDVPTSGGFYYSWRRQTSDLGCYISKGGTFYGCNATGTGRLGRYAAHPGDCDRDITLDWSRIEPTLDDLREAVETLRGKMAEFLGGAAA